MLVRLGSPPDHRLDLGQQNPRLHPSYITRFAIAAILLALGPHHHASGAVERGENSLNDLDHHIEILEIDLADALKSEPSAAKALNQDSQ